MGVSVVALGTETWPAFAALVERHNGVWGGCWCLGFHAQGFSGVAEAHREAKRALVAEGRAQAALVMVGEDCVGWAQFGRAAELTRIKNAKAYHAGAGAAPDWRIPCFFVDRGWRGKGVAQVALEGALALIAGLGGGVVESYPDEVGVKGTSSSFLHNGTVAMFERAGFQRERRIGKTRWVVRREL